MPWDLEIQRFIIQRKFAQIRMIKQLADLMASTLFQNLCTCTPTQQTT